MSTATIIATAVVLGWILLALVAAVVIGHHFAGRPEVMLSDDFAEHEDEPLEVDPPTSRPYIPRAQGGPISAGLVWERDPHEVIVPAPLLPLLAPAKDLHRDCIEAYAERDYAAICKTCTPRMGVKA